MALIAIYGGGYYNRGSNILSLSRPNGFSGLLGAWHFWGDWLYFRVPLPAYSPRIMSSAYSIDLGQWFWIFDRDLAKSGLSAKKNHVNLVMKHNKCHP